jgi:hypothetical protein
MRGISIRTWIVAVTAATASVLAHWHFWAPYMLCPRGYPADVCEGGLWPEDDVGILIWWSAFTIVLPLLWGLAVRVRRWFLLYTVGLATVISLQFSMTYVAERAGGSRVLHIVTESTALALLYGGIHALSELEFRGNRRNQIVLGAAVAAVVVPVLSVWLYAQVNPQHHPWEDAAPAHGAEPAGHPPEPC